MAHRLPTGKCLTYLVLVSLAFLVSPTTSWAASRYVRSGATGTRSGTDWTNAYTDLPASLVRGDVYYVAAGTYGPHTFNDAISGTSVITIQAATIADHGTGTGWNDAYQGQATFSKSIPSGNVWTFNTDYYTVSGVYGCSPTSTCGIKIDKSNETAMGCGAAKNAIHITSATGVGHITLQYLEVKGTGNTAPDPNNITDSGIFSATANHDIYWGHLWVHDQGGLWLIIDGNSNVTIEHSWFRNNHSTPLCHAEGIALRSGNATTGNTNLTIRYNRFENADGTAYIGTPVNLGLSGPTSSNWYVYGNVFFYNAATSNGQSKAGGVFQIFSIKIAGDFSFYSNTISTLDAGPLSSGSCNILFTGSATTSVQLLTVRNNVWYGCAGLVFVPGTGASGLVTQVWDHNSYYSMPLSGNLSEPSEQSLSGNPFRKVSQSPGADDFRLTGDTSAWTALGAPYNIDSDGLIRSSSRGAYQFTPSSRPSSATNLIVR